LSSVVSSGFETASSIPRRLPRHGILRDIVLAVGAALLVAQWAGAAEPTVPAPRRYVSDYAGVLDSATVEDLEALIGELQAKTGAEIAVVIVNSTQPLTTFDYAMKIAEAWKPGSKRLDNGVVFLAAIKDRQMFILTGYGVEGELPDGKVGEIRDQLVRPAFRSGDYAGGVRAATETMAAIIARANNVQLSAVRHAPATGSRPSAAAALLPILLLIIFLLVAFRFPLWPLFIGGPRSRGFGGFGGDFGGGGFGGGSGGFGGFGGGGFGGGGAGGDW
jgi:uncharacterized protein